MFKKLFRRFNRRMIEDDDKIAAFLEEFSEYKSGPWITADGFNIMLGFEFGKKDRTILLMLEKGL